MRSQHLTARSYFVAHTSTSMNGCEALLLGDDGDGGLVGLASSRLLSDGTLPAPKVINCSLGGAAAARAWLGESGVKVRQH